MSNDNTPTQLTVRRRFTVPSAPGLPRLQRPGSIWYDGLNRSLCYSTGDEWRCVIAVDGNEMADAMCATITNVRAICGKVDEPLTIKNSGPSGGSGVILCDIIAIKGMTGMSGGSGTTFDNVDKIQGGSGIKLSLCDVDLIQGPGITGCPLVITNSGDPSGSICIGETGAIVDFKNSRLKNIDAIIQDIPIELNLCQIDEIKGTSGTDMKILAEGADLGGSGTVTICNVAKIAGTPATRGKVTLCDIDEINGASGCDITISPSGATGSIPNVVVENGTCIVPEIGENLNLGGNGVLGATTGNIAIDANSQIISKPSTSTLNINRGIGDLAGMGLRTRIGGGGGTFLELGGSADFVTLGAGSSLINLGTASTSVIRTGTCLFGPPSTPLRLGEPTINIEIEDTSRIVPKSGSTGTLLIGGPDNTVDIGTLSTLTSIGTSSNFVSLGTFVLGLVNIGSSVIGAVNVGNAATLVNVGTEGAGRICVGGPTTVLEIGSTILPKPGADLCIGGATTTVDFKNSTITNFIPPPSTLPFVMLRYNEIINGNAQGTTVTVPYDPAATITNDGLAYVVDTDLGDGPTRIRPTRDGFYEIHATVAVDTNIISETLFLLIRKNGGGFYTQNFQLNTINRSYEAIGIHTNQNAIRNRRHISCSFATFMNGTTDYFDCHYVGGGGSTARRLKNAFVLVKRIE